jgi:hypothetical protein
LGNQVDNQLGNQCGDHSRARLILYGRRGSDTIVEYRAAQGTGHHRRSWPRARGRQRRPRRAPPRPPRGACSWKRSWSRRLQVWRSCRSASLRATATASRCGAASRPQLGVGHWAWGGVTCRGVWLLNTGTGHACWALERRQASWPEPVDAAFWCCLQLHLGSAFTWSAANSASLEEKTEHCGSVWHARKWGAPGGGGSFDQRPFSDRPRLRRRGWSAGLRSCMRAPPRPSAGPPRPSAGQAPPSLPPVHRCARQEQPRMDSPACVCICACTCVCARACASYTCHSYAWTALRGVSWIAVRRSSRIFLATWAPSDTLRLERRAAAGQGEPGRQGQAAAVRGMSKATTTGCASRAA